MTRARQVHAVLVGVGAPQRFDALHGTAAGTFHDPVDPEEELVIENRPGERRTDGLILSVSEDGQKWVKSWQAQKWEQKWLALVTRFHAGIDVPGRPVRYLKFETRGETPRPMLLQRVQVYGE